MTEGQQSLLSFIVESYNKELKRKLIPTGYAKLETSKASDKAFNEPCQLPSILIDKVIGL